MKFTQKELFSFIDQLRQTLPKKGSRIPYLTETALASKLSSNFRIENSEQLKKIARYQLYRYKKAHEPDQSIVLDSEEHNPISSTVSASPSVQETSSPSAAILAPASLQISPIRDASAESHRTHNAVSTTSPAESLASTSTKRTSSSTTQSESKKAKSLHDINSREYLRQKLKPFHDTILQKAKDVNITYEELLGVLLSFSRKKSIAEIGEEIWNSNEPSATNQVPIDTTLAIYSDCMLGKQTYTNMRKMLRANNCNAYAAWHVIREEQKKITPQIKTLPDPHIGVYFTMKDAVHMTVHRILQQESISFEGHDLKLEIKFGFDGSGSHAIYNQKKNADTNNIIMTMFCPLKLTDSSNNVVFQQPLPNSTLSQRILCLQMGKESVDSLKSLQMYNDEIRDMDKDGIQIQVAGKQSVTVQTVVVGHMLDGKAAKLYTGLGGAYCDLCHFSKSDCADPDITEIGFTISRDINQIIDFFAENVDETGNEIIKKAGDYNIRGGVTQRPIAEHQVLSTQVLHTLLRTFDHFMNVVVHIKAAVFKWSVSGRDAQFVEGAKVFLLYTHHEMLDNPF